MKTVFEVKSFGGIQGAYTHDSTACSCQMRFAVYLPSAEQHSGPFPVLYWLSGLTCTDENFVTKAGAQRMASELDLAIIAPDTSPRGEGIPDDPDGAYDFGLGAGFYVDATEAPWNAHYKMYSYVIEELPALVEKEFNVDARRTGIFGHSMGGHGALMIALKNPDKFKSVSAFSPIVSPMNCPWGIKALSGYLGADRTLWRAHDACALVEDGARVPEILVDQGEADNFLEEQLRPELLEAAIRGTGITFTLRRQPGYDHSYYFIASFMEDHLRWHAERLRR